MKWFTLLSLLFVALVVAEEERNLPLAESCNLESCQLPDCRCSSTSTPGGLPLRDVPQFVTVTFDDGVNILNIETYRKILYGRRNSNQCPAGATFYINHEYTNYQLVNELYNNGFEIALHSISHQTNQEYWSQATYEDMVREFADQKTQMSHFANIPRSEIKGIRMPFLQLAGNSSFLVIAEHGFLYDSSWPTVQFVGSGLWPYSLDYSSIQDCVISPCPTASIPKAWVSPMISWLDLNGSPCAMVDSCFAFPDREDEEAWFRFILTNFERHYLNSRAPFGFYVHEWYLSTYPAIMNALVRFMNLVNELEDTFMVTESEVIDWVRDPIPVNEYKEKPCKSFAPMPCAATSCGPLRAEHNNLDYWMAICNTCPRTYPWLGNPLGL
ncbi:chitin deacetylase 8-like [Pectinophora gossypiella]|uniref:NodB homology domain-containing protein n=1 Tax=Pectinophora gossypiella TaxID=13191 RepID=A0A1E1WFV4_PECGO|nr:chitin deacetylase 8-like [Pectinophora gossypiella]